MLQWKSSTGMSGLGLGGKGSMFGFRHGFHEATSSLSFLMWKNHYKVTLGFFKNVIAYEIFHQLSFLPPIYCIIYWMYYTDGIQHSAFPNCEIQFIWNITLILQAFHWLPISYWAPFKVCTYKVLYDLWRFQVPFSPYTLSRWLHSPEQGFLQLPFCKWAK